MSYATNKDSRDNKVTCYIHPYSVSERNRDVRSLLSLLSLFVQPAHQFYLHILQDIVEVFMDLKLSEAFAHKGK